MEFMGKIAFGLYTAIILAGAIAAVGSSSLVRALVGLITTLVGVAGMYMLLNSPFMALMQLLIYVGAVSVLIFFAVMLTRADSLGEEHKPASIRKQLYALLGATAPAAILGWVLMTHPITSFSTPTEVQITLLGHDLLGAYFLPFELISAVLMVAMSGAVLLAWERRGKK